MFEDLKTRVGVVIIGRNEGDRLKACLRSIIAPGRTVIYVDSGSNDGSVAFAESLNIKVVQLSTKIGFTAARARNAGFEALIAVASSIELVQFIDGDCTLDRTWLEVAVKFLEEHKEFAVVCGRRREIHPDRNLFHRITDLEWLGAVGEAKYCGGDALFRASAFRQVGGYRDTLIAGEEPELCVRLRKNGWKVFRLDAEMTNHDIQMTSWSQWWKRAVRSGHAYAEGARLHGAPPEKHWIKERRSIWLWGILMPFAAIATAWLTYGISVALLAAAYFALGLKTAILFHRKRKWQLDHSLLYAFHCIAAKFPQALGLIIFEYRSLLGKRSTLIEYGNQAKLVQGAGEVVQSDC